jgi:NAD kinase
MTPYNPMSISFRPLILPFDCNISIKVPEGENETPFNGCIDGDFKFMLMDGD